MSCLINSTFQEHNLCTVCLKVSSTDLLKEKCSECGYTIIGLLDKFPLYIPDYFIDEIEENNPQLKLKKEYLRNGKPQDVMKFDKWLSRISICTFNPSISFADSLAGK